MLNQAASWLGGKLFLYSKAMAFACKLDNFAFGCNSPFKSTKPISHCLLVFSERVTHSRLDGKLFSLLPSLWSTTAPAKKPSTNAKATNLCTRNLGLLPSIITDIVLYPVLLTQGDKTFPGRICVKFPCVMPNLFLLYTTLSLVFVRTLPKLLTSSRSSKPSTGFQISSAFIGKYPVLEVIEENTLYV